ncbi:MAG TPA: iron donor protein CyaY [Burkholderiales bacterium]|nr:iron donor protein CyaY [Burkholderiales bacterium]
MSELSEEDFNRLADAELIRIEQAIEASGVDADIELKDGGVLEVEFNDGSKMIINRHGVAREIWVAARSGGHHFRYVDGVWKHTRQDIELFAALSRDLSLQSGETVQL